MTNQVLPLNFNILGGNLGIHIVIIMQFLHVANYTDREHALSPIYRKRVSKLPGSSISCSFTTATTSSTTATKFICRPGLQGQLSQRLIVRVPGPPAQHNVLAQYTTNRTTDGPLSIYVLMEVGHCDIAIIQLTNQLQQLETTCPLPESLGSFLQIRPFTAASLIFCD